MTDYTITKLKRRLERWEIEHLRRHAAELAERLEAAEEDARRGWDAAESWREDTMQLMQEMMEEGRQVGITKNGQIVCDAPDQGIGFPAAMLIGISDDQLMALEPCFDAQKKQGGAIIAKIWRDGIRVKLLTDAQQRQIAKITGAPGDKFYGSAAACHIDALALAPEAA